MFGYLRVEFDWDNDGIFEENQSSDTEKKKVNKSKAKKVNIRFFNPFATDKWEIHILGAKFKDKDGSRILNITDAFVVNNTGTDIIVGMKKSVWSELAQKLGADYLRIIIPKGSSGLTDVNVNHCPDNATAANQSDCNSVYNATDTTKASCTIETDRTICDIPVNIGFSVFAVAGQVVTTPPPPPGGGGGGAATKGVVIKKIDAGTSETAVFDILDTGYVSEITVYAKDTVYNVKLVVDKIDKKPFPTMPDPEGLVLSYLKLTKTGISDAQLEKAEIKFQVSLSWLKDNNIAQDSVFLKRDALTTWEAVETEYLSEDANYAYFSAITPGFSYFAITGTTGSGYVEPLEEIPTGTEAPPVTTPAPTTTAPPTAPPTTAPPEGLPVGTIILALVVIVIIAGAAYYFSQKKPGEEGEVKVEPPEEAQEAAEEPTEEEPKE